MNWNDGLLEKKNFQAICSEESINDKLLCTSRDVAATRRRVLEMKIKKNQEHLLRVVYANILEVMYIYVYIDVSYNVIGRSVL